MEQTKDIDNEENKISIWIARVISFIFHPLFLITYFLLLLIAINPFIFSTTNSKSLGIIVIYIVILSVMFPAIPLFMMYRLGFSESMLLKKRKERTIPLALTGIFYLWLYVNMLNNNAIPAVFNSFLLGTTITLFTCFFLNLFTKVSLHTAGIAGFFTALVVAQQTVGYEFFTVNNIFGGSLHINTLFLLIIALIMAGLVGTSRLILKAHSIQDVYGGYMVGFLSQLIAMRILLF